MFGLYVILVCIWVQHSSARILDIKSLSSEEQELQQVIVLFRHGERTPTGTFPNDPYSDYPWEDARGTLRKAGMKRMFKLGQWLRKKYAHLNSGRYNSTNTYAQSSYADRCIESTQAVLAGLYPVDSKDVFAEDLYWRPIPVHSTPRNMDKSILVHYPCPRYDTLLHQADEKVLTPELARYFEELTKVSGKQIRAIRDVSLVHSTLQIEEEEGLKLPEDLNKFYKDPKMLEIVRIGFAIPTLVNEQKRLKGGPLLNRVLRNIEDLDQGRNTVRIHLYGVHDLTLANLLRTMGIEKFEGVLLKPALGATLIFEVRKSPGKDATLHLFYMNDSSTENAIPLVIPDCSEEKCTGQLKDVSLTNIRRNYKNFIPENWYQECRENVR